MKINHAKALGQEIRKRGKALNDTQVYLSELTDLSVTFTSDVEQGKATAEIEKTIHLTDFCGLDL